MPDLGVGRQGSIPKESRSTTLASAYFKIDAEGASAMFSELGGISSEVEMVEYMEAGEKGPMFGRFIGKAKPPTVTLKRAMGVGKDTTWIWTWHGLARTGSPSAYRETYLTFYGAGDPKALKTYQLVNAVPTKVEIAGAKAGATEVVIQTVTLQCDEINEVAPR
jgi:phage tail-like protein